MTDSIYGSLNDTVLGQMDGFLEPVERLAPEIQNGGAGEPSVGFGSFLRYSTVDSDPALDSLKAVLDAFTMSVTVTLNNGDTQIFSGNVYQIAAAVVSANNAIPGAPQLPIPSVSAITASFSTLTINPLSEVETDFNKQFSSWVSTGTVSGPQTVPITFTLTAGMAEVALNNELNGAQISEGLATGTLTIVGKSPQTAGSSASSGMRGGYNNGVVLENLYNAFNPSWVAQQTIGATSAIPNLAPTSTAWQAIVDSSFLGIGSGVNSLMGQAVSVSDFCG